MRGYTLMPCPPLGPWSSKKASLFGQRLYQDVVKRLADAGLGDIDTSLVELLQLCSCWGHHQASLMLATLHLSGLGVPADQEKVAAPDRTRSVEWWIDVLCVQLIKHHKYMNIGDRFIR